MSVKHFCDRCGKEVGRSEVMETRIPVEATRISLVTEEKEFCPDCHAFVKSEGEKYNDFMRKAKVAFYASLMRCEDEKGDE